MKTKGSYEILLALYISCLHSLGIFKFNMMKVREVTIFFISITATENIQLLLQLAPCRKLNQVNLPLSIAEYILKSDGLTKSKLNRLSKVFAKRKISATYRPFQERRAIAQACAHTRAKVFRRVINRTCK